MRFTQIYQLVSDDRKISGRQDRFDAGERLRLAGIDRPNAGMRVRAAQDASVEHGRQVDVGGKTGPSGYLVDAVMADGTGPDHAHRRVLGLPLWRGAGHDAAFLLMHSHRQHGP